MSIKSPSVIIDFQGFQYNDNSEKGQFYRCKNNKNILNYVDRESANTGANDNDYREICSDLRVSFDNKKSAGNILGYANNRHGSSGLFNENGFLSDKEINSLSNKMSSTKSIIWSAVISFTPEASAQICASPEQARELISNNLHLLFKNSHLDFDNIEWTGAYHSNTDNRHIHLVMFEKNPLHIDAKGNRCFSNKLTLPKANFSNFKYGIARNIDSKQFKSYLLRNDTKNSLAFDLSNDKQFLSSILHRSKDIIEKGYFQYNRLTDKQKTTVDEFVQETLRRNPKLKTKYDDYLQSLQKEQYHILEVFKHNKTAPTEEAKNFFKSRYTEFNVRLANTVLKAIKQAHNARIPYANYKASVTTVGNKNSSIMMRKKRYLDLSQTLSQQILRNINNEMQQTITNETMEQYRFEKKQKGEAIYE